MTQKPLTPIKDADFIFENSPVKIIANRNFSEVELAGAQVGPFEEGREYEVKHWIAQQLEKAGVAHIRDEEQLDLRKINNVHWKESGIVQARQLSALEENFYPKLRRYLIELKKGAMGNPDKMREHEKAKYMAQDIIDCRLRKIVLLALSPQQTNNVLKDMALEERLIYEDLHDLINEWKNKILQVTEEP